MRERKGDGGRAKAVSFFNLCIQYELYMCTTGGSEVHVLKDAYMDCLSMTRIMKFSSDTRRK